MGRIAHNLLGNGIFGTLAAERGLFEQSVLLVGYVIARLRSLRPKVGESNIWWEQMVQITNK